MWIPLGYSGLLNTDNIARIEFWDTRETVLIVYLSGEEKMNELSSDEYARTKEAFLKVLSRD